MIQVAFDGDSAEEALAAGPSRVAYAQHSGGEVADWGDSKVDKEGTHPVVYAAAGSHASYFGSAIYLGTGENGSGLGCDDTREPLRRVHPDVVTLATDPDPGGPQGWVTFEGVWGEPRGGFNGPPDGPARKRQWREPLRWMAGLRTGNPEVPGSTTIGPNVSSTFCCGRRGHLGLREPRGPVARDRAGGAGRPVRGGRRSAAAHALVPGGLPAPPAGARRGADRPRDRAGAKIGAPHVPIARAVRHPGDPGSRRPSGARPGPVGGRRLAGRSQRRTRERRARRPAGPGRIRHRLRDLLGRRHIRPRADAAA